MSVVKQVIPTHIYQPRPLIPTGIHLTLNEVSEERESRPIFIIVCVTHKKGPNAANDVTFKNEVKVRKKWWHNLINLTLTKKCK